ncbi:NTF2 fold immunity protein [Pseudomonas sp. NPDC089734]|uniref:NTF2 fold immunity protein n=1 Tax=Pseudomonas sp. NPDC089734 TaxID=3364469 RepID=UPI003824785E
MGKVHLASVFLFCSFSCWAAERVVLIKTAEDAAQIGEAIAGMAYGKENAENQKPYKAKSDGDVWVVRGTLHYQKGGVVEVRVNRFDGSVVSISHGK